MIRSRAAIVGVREVTIVLALALFPFFGALAKGKQSQAGTHLAEYLARARSSTEAPAQSLGSLWSQDGRLADMASDYKSRNVNDLILIRIVEQTRAQADGNVTSQRAFAANSGISGLLGNVSANSKLQNLFSPFSNSNLAGKAQTASNTLLTTTLAGNVVEVLPNGFLVIEAAREVEMNNERQTILVRGIVRPGDVGPDNSVFSTSVSHLEVELKGKGTISEGVRPPNKLVRALLRLAGF
jgi:flagellar L-ring protein precursor FlgH